MSQLQTGLDALSALNEDGESGGSSLEFSKFSSGSTYLVKVIGREFEVNGKTVVAGDFASYYNYGLYKKVNSFTAEKPSKKSAKGFPIEDLTPWDLAWKYHADKSEEFNDNHSKEAYKYRAKQKFMFGFIDVDTGKPIIVDLTKTQAKAVDGAIKKFAKRRDKMAFELSKEGESTGTTVSLTPYLDDLSDKQQKNFDDAPEEFDVKLFSGILYEADEDEQIQLLAQAGFDVSLIGKTIKQASSADEGGEVSPIDADNAITEEFPF